MLGDVVSNDAATLSESYLECERIATESSSSFLRAFRTLPKEKHDGIKALYAFCRRADDVADGDWLPDFSILTIVEFILFFLFSVACAAGRSR